MYKLRPYQEKSKQAGIDAIKEKKSVVLVEPTGSGKSIIIASIITELDMKAVVLQPSKEILEQNYGKMVDYGYDDIAIYSASLNSKERARITFATIGSIYKKPELFSDIDLIVIDEAHTVNSKGGMYKDFIKALGVPVLGLTATPYRMEAGYKFDRVKKRMTDELVVQAKFITRTKSKVFKKIGNVTQIKELFDQEFLTKPEYIEDETYDTEKIPLNSTGRDYDETALKKYNEAEDLIKTTFNKIIKDRGKYTLVFNKFVSEAEQLKDMLNEVGIKSAIVSSETKKAEREQIIKDFRDGKIEVVTNVGVLTTGFDFPELDTVILARPTRSLSLYYQMVGRVIRIHENKPKARLIDLCGNIKLFGKVEEFFVEDIDGLPRLKSDKGYLTGVNYMSGEDMEKSGEDVLETKYNPDKQQVMPFGKYKGTHITKLKTYYVKWCSENFDGVWKNRMLEELERRNKKTCKLD
jgi:DNA repair protein RadD